MKSKLLKNIDLALLTLLLLPLFFINISNYHNWGGDFAQYINQGMNIVAGEPHYQTGYVFNQNYKLLAPQAYPVGFPLILTPVLFFFGNDMFALQVYTTFLTLILAICTYCFLKLYTKKLFALAFCLIIFYNPWMINFKSLILSDISFSIFLVAHLISVNLMLRKNSLNWGIAAGTLGSFAFLIKSIAIILPIALAIYLVLDILVNKSKSKVQASLIAISFNILIYIIINRVFGKATDVENHYLSMMLSADIGNVFLRTSQYYIQVFQNFFHPNTNGWDFFPLILKSFALSLMGIGFIKSLINQFGYKELVVIGFLLGVFAFDNTSQGFRYLLPILPILILYIIEGLKSIDLQFTSLSRWILGLVVFLSILVSYKFEIQNIHQNDGKEIEGPLTKSAQDLFSFLDNSIPNSETIMFFKPRVLALYTKHSSVTNNYRRYYKTTEEDIRKYKVQLFIQTKKFNNPALDSYIKNNKASLNQIYENDRFIVYQKGNL